MNRKLIKIVFCLPFILAGISVYAQNNLVPNTQDCSSVGQAFQFDIALAWRSGTAYPVCPHTTTIVGDIDGDGKTEVLALSTNKNKIYVFEGTNGTKIGEIDYGSMLENENPTCFLIVDGDGDGQAEVFAAGTSTQKIYLHKVTSAPGARPITFGNVWTKDFAQTGSGVTPIVADFDGDGTVEFVAGKYLIGYDGSILGTLPFNSIRNYNISISYATDVDGDGLPEIINGSDVYKYTGGLLQLYARCPDYSTSGLDGWNMAADVNQDGDIDLAFNGTSGTLVVWTPKTGEVLGRITTTTGNSSYPFIGDIDGIEEPDGKKYLEICYNTNNKLYAYSYTGSGFTPKWTMSHSDASGVTSLTLFDFNMDGAVELIYRDQSNLTIFDGSGSTLQTLYSTACGSGTTTETPVVVDVNGDGSADLVVTGYLPSTGEVFVFQGDASKWASSPSVWNQQMYSSLYVNGDLTIPTTIQPLNLTFTRPDNSTVQFYNGGPIQSPYVSEETYLPVNLSPDVFVVDGSISVSGTNVTFTITIGNQGLVAATTSTPIQFYANQITTANIVGSTTLGVDLYPGQTTVVTFTVSGLATQFYVRILDDGTSFPALGAYSDCNLTNNTKSFGTLELFKTVNSSSACVDGTSIFYVDLENNTNLFGTPTNYTNIHLVDSLGNGWEFISASTANGTTTTFNPVTSKLEWTIPSLDAGETARLTIIAKSVAAGAIRNTAWIESVGGTVIGKEAIEAYVIVNNVAAPIAASISPTDPKLCDAGGVVLTASVSGASTYQWYKDLIEISGATQQTYTATALGNYTVSYHDGTCVSQMSSAVVVTDDCMTASSDTIAVVKSTSVLIDVLANDDLGLCNSSSITLTTVSTPSMGEVEVENQKIKYTAYGNIGTDSFTYKIKCGAQESTAAVTVTICSTLMVERIDDAKEPNSPGKFRIKYTDDSFKLEKDLEVTYSITPVNAVAGTDFVAPSGTAIIPANTNGVDVNIQPYDNFKVEGNNRQLMLTITGSTILTTP